MPAFAGCSRDRQLTTAWLPRVAAGDNAAMESFFSLLQKNVLNRRR